MTSPRLEAMAKRAARAVSVRSGLGADGACIAITDIPAGGGFCLVTDDCAEATRAYFDLVSTLESAAPSSADTAAADPASFSPEDAL